MKYFLVEVGIKTYLATTKISEEPIFSFHIPQINIALFCSLETGLPTMIRTIPESVRDIKRLYNSIVEANKEGSTIILDLGFFSKEAIKFLLEKKMSFILPARRNSLLYGTDIGLNNHLFYQDRLIKCGKEKVGSFESMLQDITMYKPCTNHVGIFI
jgi:transposase